MKFTDGTLKIVFIPAYAAYTEWWYGGELKFIFAYQLMQKLA